MVDGRIGGWVTDGWIRNNEGRIVDGGMEE